MTQKISSSFRPRSSSACSELGAPVNDPRLAPMVQPAAGALCASMWRAAGLNGRLARPAHAGAQMPSVGEDGPSKRSSPICRRTSGIRARRATSARRAHSGVHMFTQAPACRRPMPAAAARARRGRQGDRSGAGLCRLDQRALWRPRRRRAAPHRVRSPARQARAQDAQAIVLVEAADATRLRPRQLFAEPGRGECAEAPCRDARPERRRCAKRLSRCARRWRTGCFDGNAEGRKLMSAVDALLAHEGRRGGSEPRSSRSPTPGARPWRASSPRCPPTSARA